MMNNNENQQNEIEIDILAILKELWKNIWIILIVALVVAGTVFGLTKAFIKPVYRSSFTAYINNKALLQSDKDTLSYSDMNAAKELVKTYKQILTSNTVLTASAESINLDYSYKQLSRIVSSSIEDETEIITVSVTCEDPQVAYDLACAIAETSPDYMTEIVEGSSMKIIDHPVYSEVPFGPSYKKYALFGFLAGALVVIIIVLIRYFTNDVVRSEKDLEARFSIPILGVIPDILNAGKGNNYSSYEYGYASVDSTQGKEKMSNEK